MVGGELELLAAGAEREAGSLSGSLLGALRRVQRGVQDSSGFTAGSFVRCVLCAAGPQSRNDLELAWASYLQGLNRPFRLSAGEGLNYFVKVPLAPSGPLGPNCGNLRGILVAGSRTVLWPQLGA